MDAKLKEQIDLWTDQDEYDKIITAINALSDKERDFEAISELGRAFNNMGDYQGGLDTLMSIQEEGKSDYKWQYRVSYAYLGLDQPREALHAAVKATELQPEYSWGWYQRGECLYALGDYSAALKSYEKAYAIEPEDWLADMVRNMKRIVSKNRAARPTL